ncbi:MAG: SprB repeat-containing protein [Bacteroidetes bacterium]|nr:SprB repeat-containing protein [Bacteroidota bacterium]
MNNTTSPSCIPGCDGTATTNVAGGIAPYNYTISGGALISGSGFASNLCAGIIYTITVTDANGCTGSTTVQLTSPMHP